MLRRLALSLCVLVLVGCGGDEARLEDRTLRGELTDGDVIVLDNQRADPYNFICIASGRPRVRLHAVGFNGFLAVYDTEGNTLAQSTETAAHEAQVQFDATSGVKYKVMVTSSTSNDFGSYTIDYTPDLSYEDQIRSKGR